MVFKPFKSKNNEKATLDRDTDDFGEGVMLDQDEAAYLQELYHQSKLAQD